MTNFTHQPQIVLQRFPNGRGFLECNDGWHELIVELDRQLSEIDPNYMLVQCKEKFGGLRYYIETDTYDYGTPERERMDALIREAEDKSYTVCEDCGQPGKTRSDSYWRATLCDNCHKS